MTCGNPGIRIFLVLSVMVTAFCAVGVDAYEIGYTSVTFVDPDRGNRQVATEICYPADAPGRDVPAASPPEGGFSVVSYGHGFLIGWDAYDFLRNGLVPQGFVVAYPKTGGELFPDHLEFGLDIAFVSRAVRAESDNPASILFGAVSDRAAVGGHSMGGGASFLGASADSTVTAIFNLAAAETNPSAIAAAAGITAEALVLSGSLDCVTPPGTNQIPMYEALASECKTRVSITGGSHCQFAENNFFCNVGEGSCDDPTISRSRQQELVLTLLGPWLDSSLNDDPQSWSFFQGLLDTLSGIIYVQDCPLSDVHAEEEFPFTGHDGPTINVIPNPFNMQVAIEVDSSVSGELMIDVYSVTGRKIRSLFDGSISPGSRVFTWNGRDNDGKRLPSGVYMCRVESGGEVSTVRMVLVR